MNTADVKRFNRAWRKLRKMPKLWTQEELKVTPEHQFIRELHIVLGSMSCAELDQFTDQMGFEKVKGMANRTITAREIVNEVFDVFDDGLELHADPEVIEYVTGT